MVRLIPAIFRQQREALAKEKKAIAFGIALGILLGIMVGYFIAIVGFYHIVGNLQIENIIIEFNETKVVDYIYQLEGFE